jgi:hypothetical protein
MVDEAFSVIKTASGNSEETPTEPVTPGDDNTENDSNDAGD